MTDPRPLLYRILGPSSVSGDRCSPTYIIPLEATWEALMRGLSLTCVFEVTSFSKHYTTVDLWLGRDAESDEDCEDRALPPNDPFASLENKQNYLDDWQTDEELFIDSASTLPSPGTKLLLNARWRFVVDTSVTPVRLLIAFRVPILSLAPLHLSLKCEGASSSRLILAEVHQRNVLHQPVVYQVEWHNGSSLIFASGCDVPPPLTHTRHSSSDSSLAVKSLRSVFTELSQFLANPERLKVCLLSKSICHEWISFCQRQPSEKLDLFVDVGMRIPPTYSVCLVPTHQRWIARQKSRKILQASPQHRRWLALMDDNLISCPSEGALSRWRQQLVQTTLPLEKQTYVHTLQEGIQTRFEVKYQSPSFTSKEVVFISSGPLLLSWSPSGICASQQLYRSLKPITLLTETSPILSQD